MDVAELGVKVTDEGLPEVQSRILGTSAAFNRLNAEMSASVARFVAAGAAATAFAHALAHVVSTGAEFEQQMTRSTAIMGDLSDVMRNDLAQAAREMGKQTVFSAQESAESFYFLASAGLSAQASIAALPVVARFAQAGMFNMAQATELLTDSQSALGLTIRNDAVRNMENMIRVSDVLVEAANRSNGSVQQFAEALTNKAGAALKVVGKEIEEGVAVLAAYADQGVKSWEAGEKLNIVFRDMQRAALANSDAFEAFNIKVFDSEGEMRNFADIIGDVEVAFAGLTDEQRRAALEVLGFQDRSVAATQQLLGTSNAIRNYQKALEGAGGVTKDISEKQLKNLADQFGLLKSKMEDARIVAFKGFEESALRVVKSLDQWIDKNGELIGQNVGEWIDEGIQKMEAWGAVISPIVTLFGKLSEAILNIVQAIDSIDPRLLEAALAAVALRRFIPSAVTAAAAGAGGAAASSAATTAAAVAAASAIPASHRIVAAPLGFSAGVASEAAAVSRIPAAVGGMTTAATGLSAAMVGLEATLSATLVPVMLQLVAPLSAIALFAEAFSAEVGPNVRAQFEATRDLEGETKALADVMQKFMDRDAGAAPPAFEVSTKELRARIAALEKGLNPQQIGKFGQPLPDIAVKAREFSFIGPHEQAEMARESAAKLARAELAAMQQVVQMRQRELNLLQQRNFTAEEFATASQNIASAEEEVLAREIAALEVQRAAHAEVTTRRRIDVESEKAIVEARAAVAALDVEINALGERRKEIADGELERAIQLANMQKQALEQQRQLVVDRIEAEEQVRGAVLAKLQAQNGSVQQGIEIARELDELERSRLQTQAAILRMKAAEVRVAEGLVEQNEAQAQLYELQARTLDRLAQLGGNNVASFITAQEDGMQALINATQEWGRQFTDVLASGEGDWKDFTRALLEDLNRVMIQTNITNPLVTSLQDVMTAARTGEVRGGTIAVPGESEVAQTWSLAGRNVELAWTQAATNVGLAFREQLSVVPGAATITGAPGGVTSNDTFIGPPAPPIIDQTRAQTDVLTSAVNESQQRELSTQRNVESGWLNSGRNIEAAWTTAANHVGTVLQSFALAFAAGAAAGRPLWQMFLINLAGSLASGVAGAAASGIAGALAPAATTAATNTSGSVATATLTRGSGAAINSSAAVAPNMTPSVSYAGSSPNIYISRTIEVKAIDSQDAARFFSENREAMHAVTIEDIYSGTALSRAVGKKL